MPIVQIHLIEGRSLEKKRALVAKVTQSICETLEVAPDHVRIILSDMSKTNYSIAGTLIEDKKS